MPRVHHRVWEEQVSRLLLLAVAVSGCVYQDALDVGVVWKCEVSYACEGDVGHQDSTRTICATDREQVEQEATDVCGDDYRFVWLKSCEVTEEPCSR